MAAEDARLIVSWHYAAPYDFYDMASDPEDLAEFLDPQNWPESYYAVHDEQDALVGFFSYRRVNDEELEIGLGLHPDLTGQGLGLAFVRAGMAFAHTHFSATRIGLRVATFNARAIRVYEQASFVSLETYMQTTNGGQYPFLRMIRQGP
ncbi:MAG: GNAT family N-acetyltransferase [Ktedonobacteraceae bacterium]|nr:GNAT family N-acetyltransferase [Ktedonobacteraceae bacterium]